ncbi:NAD(P)-dependent alcohol dehydrogenase [Komagataeibacter oboediens]|uniref:NAD(P)-dependent alcohol dehydrogenase n=1 Tax=Komagataeibacter oboediens TaxID=65958 RepID=UPI001C2CCAE9|nr:NAD(P)-dependent alcohol dehydrogenase [Komagataeibacter oboediens]MBV1825381.1 NAD(P)-dependent alcohol dehydrogenase [Komagataeibacter oboediens]
MKTHGFFAESAEAPLKPFSFDRRDVRSNDVAIEILYCGVCHSDLHQARNDWGNTLYPSVPGHEIVGRVTDVGSDVTHLRVGDKVAVGCMVDSCSHCDQCRQGDEQYCREGATWTYNGVDRVTKEVTFGGYSRHIVVRDDFVLSVPENLDLSRVAPILCAGITTYSPLRFRNVGPGSRVGVAGLGGLGHMAVKLAAGLGADVTVISRSKSKEDSALALGADRFLVSTDEQAMKEAADSFDLIIDTIPVQHDVSEFFPLVDIDGAIVMVGQLGATPAFNTSPLLIGRRQLAGSIIGGIAQTQELLDFCGRKNILADCEMIRMDEINEAFVRLEKGDVHYRFVIDMASFPETV